MRESGAVRACIPHPSAYNNTFYRMQPQLEPCLHEYITVMDQFWNKIIMILLQSSPWKGLRTRWMSEEQAPWKLLPWLLLSAYGLRLVPALSSDYVWRPDELGNYLEQAHRVVFGYGIITWDYGLKIRSWLVAGLPIGVLQFCVWLGLDQPDHYIPVMRVLNATLSLSIPIGTYVLCRRILQENTARVAFIISCFWYELVVMAPHTLAEFYATILFFSAAALMNRPPSFSRVSIIGLILGFAIAFRPHYAISISIFGLMFLFLLPNVRIQLFYLLGGIVACLTWGFVDRMALGGWWASIFNYYFIVTDLFEHTPYTAPSFVERLPKLFTPSLGLLYVAVLWCLSKRIKILFPIAFPFLALLSFHLMIHVGTEYSNYQLAIPLAIICIADLTVVLVARSVKYRAAKQWSIMVTFATLSGFSLMGMLPGLKYTELSHNNYINHNNYNLHGLYRYMSRLPSKQVYGVFLDAWVSGGTTGAYYFLHQRVPFIQPGMTYEGTIDNIGYDVLLDEQVSHVVTLDTSCFDNFEEIASSGVWHLLERRTSSDSSQGVTPRKQLELDLTPADAHLILKANQLAYFSWRKGCRANL